MYLNGSSNYLNHTAKQSENLLACERRRISGCHLIPPKNNVCETEPGNNFCDVMTFVSPWPIRFHDRMKLEWSSQRIPHAVVLGLFELNCDWLRIPTSQKSFSGSGSAEPSDSRKYVCVLRLKIYWQKQRTVWIYCAIHVPKFLVFIEIQDYM